MSAPSEVTIRELRNHGGEVVDRVAAGEHLTVTRSGKPVAALHPLERPAVRSEVLLERWRRLPQVAAALRRAGRKPTARSYDAMIAAVAVANSLPLHTCNPVDLTAIEQLHVVDVPHPGG